MDPMENSAVLPKYCHVTAHICSNWKHEDQPFLGSRSGPRLACSGPGQLSYDEGRREENTSETHQDDLRNKDRKRKRKLLKHDITHSPLQRDNT